jgi:hypothetical protein
MYLKMEIEDFVDYLKRAETAEVLYCEIHDSQYFDFEKKCPSCIREEQEGISEMQCRLSKVDHIIDSTTGNKPIEEEAE